MAQDNRVHLKDPNGTDFYASSPAEVNTLVFGQGYKVVSHDGNVDKALAKLAEKAAEPVSAAQADQTVAPK